MGFDGRSGLKDIVACMICLHQQNHLFRSRVRMCVLFVFPALSLKRTLSRCWLMLRTDHQEACSDEEIAANEEEQQRLLKMQRFLDISQARRHARSTMWYT